jgi:Tol biopolymer transport system component
MVTLIEFGPGIQYVEATDGQRVVYWNADRTTLLIGDKTGKTKTEIFKTTANRRPRVEVSRDLSMAFLFFMPSGDKSEESYAIIRTDGSGIYREVIWPEQGKPGTMPLYGVYWSFDNRYILVCKMNAGDRLGHVLKLSVDGGQIVEVPTAQTMDFVNAAPSPDGRSIALEVRIGGIFLMPAQGGPLELVAQTGAVADWTQDGSHLVYGAFEKEVFSLFAVPVKDSRVGGERIYLRGVAPTQITRPVTTGSSLTFMHSDGTPNSQQVYHASLGADGKLGPWTALKTIGIRNPYAVWSPDDTRFAYISRAANNRTSAVRIYTLATGDDRELFRSDESILNCLWAARPAVIYCSQPRRDSRKTDILAIDEQTGRSEIVATFDGFRTIHALSPDNRILYMYNLSGPTPWPRWEIGADQEVPGSSENSGFASDDQRWLARASSDATGRREYQIRPQGQAGEWRSMMPIRKQAPAVNLPVPAMFTRDGNWIVIHNLDESGKDTLYRMPTAGGEPEALGTYPTDRPNSYLRVSHDGRQFLVGVMPRPSGESVAPAVWQLQNFIPAAATAKR